MSTTDHPFVPAGEGDKRSPCPALNSLANHGYLPHDGKKIGFSKLVHAIRTVYNLSYPLAFALALGGTVTCGNVVSLDLDNLALHNRIEHDGSLAHGDTVPGQRKAPIAVDQELVHTMTSLAHEEEGGLNLDGFARLRVDREAGLRKSLDFLHSFICKGEIALAWQTFKGEDGRVPQSTLEQWYGEERLPEGWVPPAKQTGVNQTVKIAGEVAGKMKQIKRRQE